MACEPSSCQIPLRAGWNTWLLARVIPEGSELTAETLRAEIEQLMGFTPLGLLTSIGTILPSADARNIGIHTFLGGADPEYTDMGALGDAERELASRAWQTTGIRDLHNVNECHDLSAAVGGTTMVLVDFYWTGEATQIPWPSVRWLRTPAIPLGVPAARIPRYCATEADIYLAEYWGAQPDRDRPPTLSERAAESLSGGARAITAAIGQTAYVWGTAQLAIAAALGVGLVVWLTGRG